MSDVPHLLSFIRLPSYERSAAVAGITDIEEQALEQALIANPEAGAIVQGTGGVSKVRIGLEGRGKRGAGRVYFLYAYAKNESENLTSAGKVFLRAVVAKLREE